MTSEVKGQGHYIILFFMDKASLQTDFGKLPNQEMVSSFDLQCLKFEGLEYVCKSYIKLTRNMSTQALTDLALIYGFLSDGWQRSQ